MLHIVFVATIWLLTAHLLCLKENYQENEKSSATHIFQIPLDVASPVLAGYICNVLAHLCRIHGSLL